MKHTIILILMLFAAEQRLAAADKKLKALPPSALDLFLEEARKAPAVPPPSNGSLFSSFSSSLYLFHDVRAHNANDIVTIQINETDSATNSANTSTQKNTTASLAAPGAFGLERSTHLDFTKL